MDPFFSREEGGAEGGRRAILTDKGALNRLFLSRGRRAKGGVPPRHAPFRHVRRRFSRRGRSRGKELHNSLRGNDDIARWSSMSGTAPK